MPDGATAEAELSPSCGFLPVNVTSVPQGGAWVLTPPANAATIVFHDHDTSRRSERQAGRAAPVPVPADRPRPVGPPGRARGARATLPRPGGGAPRLGERDGRGPRLLRGPGPSPPARHAGGRGLGYR